MTDKIQTNESPKEEVQNSTIDEAVSSPRYVGSKDGKPVRIYIDGCWDVMHSGHYNAIRQAKGLGDILVVGVHSDEEIEKNKREPVMKNEERLAMVRACKWTDEVVFDVPYSPTIELIDSEAVRADYVAHGDDIPHDANGKSAYEGVITRLKIFKRTPGVSTTALIERLLLAVTSNNNDFGNRDNEKQKNNKGKNKNKNKEKERKQKEDNEQSTQTNNNNNNNNNNNSNNNNNDSNLSVVSWSQFLATSHRLSAFSNHRVPQPDDTVVYIDGSWDLFHPGHVAALKKAKSLGTFLYVGLYDDSTIRAKQGKYWPMMSLQERTLNVLSCRYVDEVVIGCPWAVSRDMVNVLNMRILTIADNVALCPSELQRYDTVKEVVKIEKLTDLESNLRTQDFVERIIKDHNKYSKQNETRIKKELKYITEREYVEEK